MFMGRRLLLALLLVVMTSGARAQVATPTGCFATLSLTTSPTLLSTATIGPNTKGCTWPTAAQFEGYVFILNDAASSGSAYLCPLGDTTSKPCSAGNGLERAAGTSWGFYRPSSQMKAVAGSTATVQIQW